jgi:hypothetical protein
MELTRRANASTLAARKISIRCAMELTRRAYASTLAEIVV